ncbi:unnamed protein product, partial [Onchocerca ochengi]
IYKITLAKENEKWH